MTTYTYWPVVTSNRQFRLVTLLPGAFADEIYISLEIANLDDFTDSDESDEDHEGEGDEEGELEDDGGADEVPSDGDNDEGGTGSKDLNNGISDSNGIGALSDHAEQKSVISETTMDPIEVSQAENDEQYDEWDENVGDRVRTKTKKSMGYECLSYAWGDEQDPQPVQVLSASASGTGDAIMITRNLEEALRHLRYEDEARRYFIDAISIDQTNLTERSEQVTLMGAIYRQATVTTIWLGPADDDSDRGMRLLSEIGQQITVDYREDTIEETDWSDWLWYHWTLPLTSDDPDKMAVYHLLGRPWFSRLWVRQELSLSKDPVVMCGKKMINWKNIATCGFLFYLSIANFHQAELDREFNRRRELLYRLCRVEQYGIFYKFLRYTIRDIGFKDPRDAIYAVTDLLPEREQLEDLQPDYTKPVSEVYTEVVLALAKETRNLGIITSCELDSLKLSALPSWVPDFSSPEHTFANIDHHWSACAWISSQAEVVEQGVLRVSAVRTCIVKSVISTSLEDDELNAWALIKTFQQAMKDIDPDGLYPHLAGCTNIEAFCLAIAGGPPADTYQQRSAGLLTMGQCVAAMRDLLSSEAVPKDDVDSGTVLQSAKTMFPGRNFFFSEEGHFGLGPAAARPGDVISVILGVDRPMVLRPAAENIGKWQVVGPAQVPGLMEGQAIYGAWEEGWQCWYSDDLPMIDQRLVALRNDQDGTIWNSPEVVLKEKSFDVKEYVHYPHILEVDFEELRRNGVQIEKLDLI